IVQIACMQAGQNLTKLEVIEKELMSRKQTKEVDQTLALLRDTKKIAVEILHREACAGRKTGQIS
ncbi:hypothetical protein K2P96_01060, partial [Patescibacteria group bacterium]|nr:hypothetical protein [Patescibacteria group bacterium]